ncbi:MAG: phospholipase A [Pseudomonadota bacterium]|nr:phospholipase A [Pseudomonadota bacterium]MEC8525682.1 phospholipase A [Pseudomonadota bacterium]
MGHCFSTGWRLLAVLVIALPAFATELAVESTSGSSTDTVRKQNLIRQNIPAEVKTETVEIEVISEDEFPDEARNLPTLIDKVRTEMLASENPYVLLPHRPNYFLPLTWQARPSNTELRRALNQFSNDDVPLEDGYDHLEAIVQLSLKYIIAEDVLGNFSRIELGYTNRSFWQVYNSDISRPFRETNHEPELMISWMLKDQIVDYVRLSLNHQSNGQTSTLSRSWNRIIGETAFIVGSGVINTKLWWRIPEGKEADPEDPKDNDNPDIDDYMGYGELNYVKLMERHQFSMMLRNNLDFSENRGAVELGYSFPLTKKMKGYVQYFNGYGESLIDYNRYQERIGVGIKLTDWF